MAKELLANAYQRKYYDVEINLNISAQCTKRIYVDEIEQYTNDMNKEMLLNYSIDKNYQRSIMRVRKFGEKFLELKQE